MRLAVFSILILVAGSQSLHAEARLDPILPGPLVEPLTLPAPQVEPSDPRSLLDRLRDADTIKIDISDQGLIALSAITTPGGQVPACQAAFRPAVPLLSAYAPLPFVASLGVGRTHAELSVAENLRAAVARLEAGDLAIRLGTDLDFLLGLRREDVAVAQQVELPLEIVWPGASFEVNLISLIWLPELDLSLLSSRPDAEGQLEKILNEPILRIGGSKSLLSTELRREQSYLVGDLSFHPPSAEEPGEVQPRARIRIREQGRELSAELHASLEIAQELAQGRCVDLLLEFSSERLSLQRFRFGRLREQRIRVRLAF